MRKIMVFVMAIAMTSCANGVVEEFEEMTEQAEETRTYSEDYRVMYEFLTELYASELFEMEKPGEYTYEQMMYIAAPIVQSDIFGDTFAEGDCEQVYRLMLAWFSENEPDAEITAYLSYIIENRMY